MRTKLYYTGYNIGWAWGAAYASGTKASRRDIRRKLARMSEAFGQFVTGVADGFSDLCEQRSEAILTGQAKRTINPHKLANVLARVN